MASRRSLVWLLRDNNTILTLHFSPSLVTWIWRKQKVTMNIFGTTLILVDTVWAISDIRWQVLVSAWCLWPWNSGIGADSLLVDYARIYLFDSSLVLIYDLLGTFRKHIILGHQLNSLCWVDQLESATVVLLVFFTLSVLFLLQQSTLLKRKPLFTLKGSLLKLVCFFSLKFLFLGSW